MTPVEWAHQVNGFAWRQEQETYRVASLIAAIYDQNRDRKKRRKPITADDILGRKRKRSGATTAEAQLAILMKLTQARGGTIATASQADAPPAMPVVR